MDAGRTTWRRRTLRGLGFILACGLLLAPAELYLRLFPPVDLREFLGDESPDAGVFAADEDFAVGYPSWAALRDDNLQRLQSYLPLEDWSRRGPGWAFFGNSFVHAPDMLCDTIRRELPDQPVFNLGRNEPLPVRCAQLKVLLENGLKPERIFVELMPVDLIVMGSQPLSTIHVTERGALTYAPRLPGGPLDWAIENSRLALTAWCRTGLQKGRPFFHRRSLVRKLDPDLVDDVVTLFAGIARVAREHDVPVTVLLIPSHDCMCRGVPCTFQDTLAPRFRAVGLDVFDPRDAFCNHPRKGQLFIPDLHFNKEGNLLLLHELQAHLQRLKASAAAQPTSTRKPT
ncbi:MAG: hypothetical protein AB7K24_07595 [Gemmataceae bacterium]